MADAQLRAVVQHLRRIVGRQEDSEATDERLLERVVAGRDQAAFEVLVWRHGPMVLGVCQRVLGNLHDAEDAFQATFLTLARKAGAVRKREALPAWLYKVAYRIALRARASALTRAAHEEQTADLSALQVPPAQPDEAARAELRALLDEELCRLPDSYRAPLVLCYLQGKSHAQAARELGRPVGSMSRYVARARELLCRRLARRGVVLSVALIGTVLAKEAATTQISAVSVSMAVRISLAFTAGVAALARDASPRAVALAEGAIKAMAVARLKTGAALVVGLTLALGGAGLAAHRTLARTETGTKRPGPMVSVDTPKPEQAGVTEPLGQALKLSLTANKDTYGLGPRHVSPLTGPEVDLDLELWNTGERNLVVQLIPRLANDAERKLGSGDSLIGLELSLKGPGVKLIGVGTDLPFKAEPMVVRLGPGQRHRLSLKSLSYPTGEGQILPHYTWDRPGDYTLTATLAVAVAAAARHDGEAPGRSTTVFLKSNPVNLKVVGPRGGDP